jgi:uncharacterized membrane protein (UPF0127 family)
MFSRRRFLPLLAAVCAALLTACGNDAPKTDTTKTVEDRFAIRVGARTVQMQVAVLAAETQKGLMFRKSMGADEGMVFVFDRPQQMSFWMRNTEIPLDIGYFDADGVLREVYPMYPHDERPVYSRSGRIQFCLEMNQGWFSRAGVRPGDRLDLAALAAALRARGLSPAQFGLR